MGRPIAAGVGGAVAGGAAVAGSTRERVAVYGVVVLGFTVLAY